MPSDEAGAERPESRLRTWGRRLLIGVTVFVLGLVLLIVRVYQKANEVEEPSAPELAHVDLSHPVVDDIHPSFLDRESRPRPLVVRPKRFNVWSDRRTKWHTSPAKSRKAFDTDVLGVIRRTFLRPGCPPPSDLEEAKTLSHARVGSWFAHTARVLGLRATLWAHEGRAAEALDEWLLVTGRMIDVEQRCKPDLVLQMLAMRALSDLQLSARWLLSHRDLDDAQRARVWRRLAELETRGSPMPNMIRHHVRPFEEAIAKAAAENTLVNVEETLAVAHIRFRRAIWMAEQPPGSGAIARRFPEDPFIEAPWHTSGYYGAFRRNAQGRAYLALMNDFRESLIAWPVHLCRLAARRHAWGKTLQKRGAALPTDVGVPLNPWTNAPFDTDDHVAACMAPASVKSDPLSPFLPPLPEVGPAVVVPDAPETPAHESSDASPKP